MTKIDFGLRVDKKHSVVRGGEGGGGGRCAYGKVFDLKKKKILVLATGLIYIRNYILQPYLTRASWPIASAFPETLPQKALTRVLSISVRLIFVFFSFLIKIEENKTSFGEARYFIVPRHATPHNMVKPTSNILNHQGHVNLQCQITFIINVH